MITKEIIGQIFGIFGLLFAVGSFQAGKNKVFFLFQGLSGLMFCLNFVLVGAVSAALFNLTNLVRGIVFSKGDRRIWKLVVIEILYTLCFIFGLFLIKDNMFQIFLSALTFLALTVMSVFMWHGNGKYIRYFQFLFTSPAWIVHNIFNFTLGGILCEVFNMVSVIVSFVRFGRDGFER